MEQNDILGIQATINGQDIEKGSQAFVAKVSDMERASDKLINSMGDGFNWLNSQIKSLTDSLEENRLKLQEIFFQMGSIKPSNKASQEAYNDLQQQYEKALGGQRELEEQLENVTQKMEAQKEAYQRMLSAQRGTSGISANNQVAQSLNDVKSLKEELKLVEAQIKSNEKSYQENIKTLDAYEQRIMQLERLKAKGQQRVIVDKDKSLSANTSEELESQKTKYEELRKKQGELNSEIEQQKKRQSELNVLLEQSNEKVVQFNTQLTSIKQQMMEMRKNGQDNTDEFKKLQEQASALQEVIDDTNNEIKLASSQKLGFQATKEGLTLLTGALTGATAVMSMFNSSSEDVEKMQKRLQEVMALTMAVQQLYSVTLSTSALKTYALGKAKLFLVNTTNTLRNSFVGLGLSATGASIAVTALYAALTLGISAAITAIVTAISSWIDKTDKAKKKQEEQAKLLENESAIRKQAAQSIIKQLSEYKKLQNEWKNLNGALDKQNKFIKDNEDAFSKLGVAVKNVSDAENLFVKNESAFIESVKHRALAAAAMAQMEDEYKKVIDSMIEADSYISKGGDTGTKKTAETLADEHIKALLVQNGVVNSKDNAYKYLQAIKSGKNNADLKGFDYTKEYRSYYKKQLENLSKQEALQLYDFSKIRQEAEKRINKFAGIASSESMLADKLLSDNGIKKYNSIDIKYNEELDKYKILLDRQAREKKRSEEDDQLAIDEAWIAMQEDSLQKRLNILGLNYDKQMMQLERQQEDELIKLIEDERTKFEANPANKGKKFDPTGIELSPDAIAKYEAMGQQIMSAFLKGQNDIEKERESSMRQYLINYGTYNEKKLAITQEYEEKIKKAQANKDDGQVLTLKKQMQEALSSIDMEQLKESINWELVFGDLSKQSKKALSAVQQQLKTFKQSNDYKSMGVEQKKVIDEALDKIQSTLIDKSGLFGDLPNQLTLLAEAQQELTDAQNEYNKALESGTDAEKEQAKKKLNDAQNNVQNQGGNVELSKNKTVNNLLAINDALLTLGSGSELSLSQIGNTIGTLIQVFAASGSQIGAIISGTLELLDMIGSIGIEKLIGNVLQSIGHAIGSIWDSVGSIFGIKGMGSIFKGADYTNYNKMKEEYDNLIDVWDTLIQRKQQYIDISYGDEARKVGQEALDLYQREMQSARILGIERLNSGASTGSHSIGVRIRKNMSSEGWNELQKAAREIGFNYNSVADGRMEGLFKLSAEQLDELRSKAPTFWAKLDDDVREYLNQIIECNDRIEEMKEKLKESTTGVSFDSFYDSFVDKLMDMDKKSKDFADDFGQYLMKSILQNLVANKYRDQIQALYDAWYQFSDSNGDGNFDLTTEEKQQLQEQQRQLAEQMIAERDALAEVFGFKSSSYSQEASSKGFQSMSQDTGEELNGRFTALQIAGEEIKAQSMMQTEFFKYISQDTSAIKFQIAWNTKQISEMIDIQHESNEHLSAIQKNTNQLYEMNDRLDKIEKNTRNL